MIKKPKGKTVHISYFNGSDSTIYSNIDITIDLSRYDILFEKAQKVLINQIKADCEPYVPAKDLTLSNSAHIENNNTELVYSTPYARYQYAGYVMTDEKGRTFVGKGEKKPIVTNRELVYSKDVHPKATKEWYEVAEKVNKDKWIKKVKEVVNNG